MALRLEITSGSAPVRVVLLDTGRNVVVAGPGEQYRLVGDRGEIPAGVSVRRVNNALVVDGLPADTVLELNNFFGACRPGSDCTLALEPAGTALATVTNESLPLAALSDGSFLLYGTADNALPAATVASGAADTGLSPGALAAAGLAALLGLGAAAGGGGGGGDSSSSTAVLGAGATAPTPAPTPPPATTPPATPPAVTPPAVAPPGATPTADTTPPSVAITDDTAAGTANGPVTFTFRFSEPVIGFTADDVVVGGGTKGALVAAPDGLSYAMTVAPTAGVQAGQITVDVAAGAVIDNGGNANTAAPRATQAYDTAIPTVTITDDAPGVTNRATVFTFTFTEVVAGFVAADVVVTGGTPSALSSADGRIYTMTVTPAAGVAAGQITVDVPAGVATDGGGNTSLAATRDTQPVDTLAPTQRVASFRATDNVAPRTGNLTPGEVTNDTTPTMTLTLNAVLAPGEVLTLTRDGAAVAAVTTGQTLNYQEGILTRGEAYTYAASIVDAAGNGTLLDLNGAAAGSAFVIAIA